MNLNLVEKIFNSTNGDVYYWVNKNLSKITLVFLHGLTANHNLFNKQYLFFLNKYSIIALDLPQHGKSISYRNFSYNNIVEDLKQILFNENKNKVILIGQSMGGFIAQSFIRKYGDMVSGFIAIDTCPYGDFYYTKLDILFLKQIKWMLYLFPHNIYVKLSSKLSTVYEDSYNNMLQMLSIYSKRELYDLLYLGYKEFILENYDLEIKCRVCLILGDRDNLGKVKKYMREWSKKENYPLHLVKNASHNSNDDQAEIVNLIIDDFISHNNQKIVT